MIYQKCIDIINSSLFTIRKSTSLHDGIEEYCVQNEYGTNKLRIAYSSKTKLTLVEFIQYIESTSPIVAGYGSIYELPLTYSEKTDIFDAAKDAYILRRDTPSPISIAFEKVET